MRWRAVDLLGIKLCVVEKRSFSFLEKCVLPFHFAQSSVSAISNSRHDNVRASSTLFIWLNENVRFFVVLSIYLGMLMFADN